MRRLRLPAILAAVSVLTIAGVGSSASTESGLIEMMDFEELNETLLGYPNKAPPLGWFQRTDQTVHLPTGNPHLPPSPIAPAGCRGQFIKWNRIIGTTPEGPA